MVMETKALIMLLTFGGFLMLGLCPEVTGQDSSTAEPVSDGVSCYACGNEDIDPEKDVKGSFGDAQRASTPAGKKMYNFTCDIADKLPGGLDDKWIRKCPHGTKSCYWAQGTYGSQEPVFRGCAETVFQFDDGCHRQLQAVELVAGRTSANVEIYLCFCSSDNCNAEASSGILHLASCTLIAILFVTFLLFSDWGISIFN